MTLAVNIFVQLIKKLTLSSILDSIRQHYSHYRDDKSLSNSISVALSTNKDKFERVDPTQRKGAWRFTKSYRPRTPASTDSVEKPSISNGKSETSLHLSSLSDFDDVFANRGDFLPSSRSDEINLNQKPSFSYAQLIIQAISKAPGRQEIVV